MTWPLIAGIAILAVLVGTWLAYNLIIRGKREQPEPTPWADSTKVAEQVRQMRDDHAGRG